LDGREVDIYLEDQKIGFEYNGLYWHSEVQKGKNYHYDKYKLANELGIQLVQVFSHEWMKRNKQVCDRIRAILGVFDRSVFARKCSVESIDLQIAKEFCENNHIQGYSQNTTIAFGLTLEGELLSIACFGRHHRDANQITLNRFCSLPGVRVVGGLARLSSAGLKHFNQAITTWCDLRWSSGDSYLAAGWQDHGTIKPDYFYSNNAEIFISKQSRKKSIVKTPDGMTESEHAAIDGLFRVWDCGKRRFIMYPVNN
jgi:hypothetical protein